MIPQMEFSMTLTRGLTAGKGLLRYFPLLLLLIFVLGGCASLPDNSGREMSFAFEDTEDTKLGQVYRELSKENPDGSGYHLLVNGFDAFAMRLVLAREAERCIDAQYYMVHADQIGALFVDFLLKAADRGVRVRLLIDDMDLEGRDTALSVLAAHPNVYVRIFNPFHRDRSRIGQYVSRLGDVTRRMHNKSFTVDNQYTIVGGRNIGNEYFNADPDLAFGDLDLLAVGPVVKKVSNSFDTYWNNSRAYPIGLLRPDLADKASLEEGRRRLAEFLDADQVHDYAKELTGSQLVKNLQNDRFSYEWGPALVLADHPDKVKSYKTTREFSLARQITPVFNEVQEELLIFSPYFVPGKGGTKFLTELSRRGVRVRIVTNSLASTDVGLVHAGYAKYRKRLLKAGVELYEINKIISKEDRKEKHIKFGSSKSSLHAKAFVFDRQKVFIGSLNLDPRSVTENTEIGILLESENIADDMSGIFDIVVDELTFRLEMRTDAKGLEDIFWHGREDGREKVWTADPHTTFLRRLAIELMGFLPIESQL